jgi:hypothetical protein
VLRFVSLSRVSYAYVAVVEFGYAREVRFPSASKSAS